MKIVTDDYRQIFAILEDGTKLRLAERHGRLEVSAYDGTLVLYPTSSNVVEISGVSHFALDVDAEALERKRAAGGSNA